VAWYSSARVNAAAVVPRPSALKVKHKSTAGRKFRREKTLKYCGMVCCKIPQLGDRPRRTDRPSLHHKGFE
jgi:hypothetical protein